MDQQDFMVKEKWVAKSIPKDIVDHPDDPTVTYLKTRNSPCDFKEYNPDRLDDICKGYLEYKEMELQEKFKEHVNTIRWRRQVMDEEQIESNARFVQWEDDTISLVVGDKFFDLKEDKNDSYLYVVHDVTSHNILDFFLLKLTDFFIKKNLYFEKQQIKRKMFEALGTDISKNIRDNLL